MLKKKSNCQKSYLRKEGQALKPVIQIGKNGLSESLIESIQEALNNHELVKIKFVEHKDKKHQIIESIIRETESQLIQTLGHTILIFRENLDKNAKG